MASETQSDVVRQASTWSIAWGALLMILGALAIASPLMAAVAVNVVISWLIVVGGLVHLITAFHSHRAGSLIWRVLVGLAYVFFGVYLIAHPAVGVASLTLVLATLFLLEGILNIALYFHVRAMRRAGWFLLDGIISLILGLMIYRQWPSSSAWAIGTLVGISLIVSGVTRLMLSFAVRNATDQVFRHAA